MAVSGGLGCLFPGVAAWRCLRERLRDFPTPVIPVFSQGHDSITDFAFNIAEGARTSMLLGYGESRVHLLVVESVSVKAQAPLAVWV